MHTSFFLVDSDPFSLAASCLQLCSANKHTCSREIPCTEHERFIIYIQPTHRNTYFTYQYFIPTCAHLNSTHLVDGSRASGVTRFQLRCIKSTCPQFQRVPQERDLCNLNPYYTTYRIIYMVHTVRKPIPCDAFACVPRRRTSRPSERRVSDPCLDIR